MNILVFLLTTLQDINILFKITYNKIPYKHLQELSSFL